MRWKPALIETLLLALLTASLLHIGTRMMKQEADRLNSLVIRRTLKPVAALLEDAYRGKDDLQMQRVVAALSGAPGVTSVCVIDTESKILAHSEPARVGEPWKRAARSRASWGAPLKDSGREWGTVIFSMSDRPVQHWIQNDQKRTLLAAAVFIFFLLWRIWIWEHRLVRLADRIADQEVLMKEARGEQERLRQQLDRRMAMTGTWLQEALDRIPGPHLLLDERQRIVAANFSALALMEVRSLEQVLGRSWYDLPLSVQAELSIQAGDNHTWVDLSVKNKSISRANLI